MESFVAELADIGPDRFDLRGLPPILRLEIAYGLQSRVDERATKTRPDQLARLLTPLARAGASSLLDRPRNEWLPSLGLQRKHVCRRFLLELYDRLEDLRDGSGWDVEYERDVWQLRRLGFPTRDRVLRFDGVEPGWLRPLAKRWARWQISTGTALGTVAMHLRGLTHLTTSCTGLRRGPHALTRAQLERHLAWLAATYPDAKTRLQYISALATFLRAIHQHRWEPRLPVSAAIYREDYPRVADSLPRALPEQVMTQLEDPVNLDRFPDPGGRLLLRVLIATGLRVGDATRLALDCLVHDAAGAPYLRYRNHKMRRDALVPIDTELAACIVEQQHDVRMVFPSGSVLFPRVTRNPDGHLPCARATFVGQLDRWLRACDLRDATGSPVHVTPHQWRHTYATRLINNDVPQEIVRRLLDHSSHGMTARYARVSDHTIRAHWERARKVDIRGDAVPAEPDGALADAV